LEQLPTEDHFIWTDSTQFRIKIADAEQNPEVNTSDLDPEAVRDEVRKHPQISDIPVSMGLPMNWSCESGRAVNPLFNVRVDAIAPWDLQYSRTGGKSFGSEIGSLI
jgi:hypothetical protein